MDEEEFKAWIAEIQLSTIDSYPGIKEQVLGRCSIFGKYAYELKQVLEEKAFELYPPLLRTLRMPTFKLGDQELLAYSVPISKLIEENSVKDIQEIEDREFTVYVEQAGVQSVEGGDRSGGVHASGHHHPEQAARDDGAVR